MSVTAHATPAGRTRGGTGAEVTRLTLDNGRVRIGVLTYGATVVEVLAPDRHGVRDDVVLSLPDLAAYERALDRAYVGSTMGRFARIVPGARLDVDGRQFRLTANAGAHHIHGGDEGFDARVWTGEATGGPREGRIVLSLVSPAGDQGYPGTLTCTVTFALDVDDRITMTAEATTDAPTLCGLSNHVFWNLAGGGTVDGHLLQVNTSGRLEAGPDFVPTGRVVPVAKTPLDLRRPRPLWGLSIDAFFPVPAVPSADGAAADGAAADGTATDGAAATSWVARLADPVSGRSLVVSSDRSGMAVYTGDTLPTPRAGICLQPGPWPHLPQAPAFPGSLLRPGQTYRSTVTFDLSTFDLSTFDLSTFDLSTFDLSTFDLSQEQTPLRQSCHE